MNDGRWVTQVSNAAVLAEAFRQCEKVILFFSVNKSKAFQGVARMGTEPSEDNAPPRWAQRLRWEYSAPFFVEVRAYSTDAGHK
jgi:YTH domain-containing protein 1